MDKTLRSAAFEDARYRTKFLGKVFGCVGLGLLISALFAFLVGYQVANTIVTSTDLEATLTRYGWVLMVAGILLFVDLFLMRLVFLRRNISLWIPYIVYCALFGTCLSTLVVAGIPFDALGEAFGLSALVFLILFVIGYFAPFNINVIGFIGLALLFGIMVIGGFFGILALMGGGSYETINMATVGLFYAVMLILIACDCYNLRRYGDCENTNMVLYATTNLYTDFIWLFLRVLAVVLRNRK